MIMRYTTAFLLFASTEVFAKKTFGVNQSLSIADQCDAVNDLGASKYACRNYGRNDKEKLKSFKNRGQPCKWFTRTNICKERDFEFPDNSVCRTETLESQCIREGCKWNKKDNRCTAINVPKSCDKLKKLKCRRSNRCQVEHNPGGYACVDKQTPQPPPAQTGGDKQVDEECSPGSSNECAYPGRCSFWVNKWTCQSQKRCERDSDCTLGLCLQPENDLRWKYGMGGFCSSNSCHSTPTNCRNCSTFGQCSFYYTSD